MIFADADLAGRLEGLEAWRGAEFARLRLAAEAGRERITVGALPGSSSRRNAERPGFRVAYTQIIVRLGPA